MKIDKRKVNNLIKDKYQITDNTFSFIPKDNPKDRIDVEIGDSKQPNTFYPQVKIARWDNECNVSIRLKDNEIGEEEIKSKSADSDKIVWLKGNMAWMICAPSSTAIIAGCNIMDSMRSMYRR
jgi:hypothetical protein